MEHIFKELVSKKARVRIKHKYEGFKLIPVQILGIQINAYDFHHNKQEIKISVSIELLEKLPKNSLTKLQEVDSIPISLLRTF